jgi:lactate permease
MQGIAGFGVPVAVVAPLMVLAGFSPVQSIAAAMIGHSWAIFFGSMGSSFFAIGLVMELDSQVLGPPLALMFFLPILLTGFSVAHIAEGWSGARRAAPLILLASVVMNTLMWGLNVLGSAPVSSMLPGFAGAIILWVAGCTSLYYVPTSSQEALSSVRFSFRWAFLPYALLTVFLIAAQIPAIRESTAFLRFALDFPAQVTELGFQVSPAEEYAPIRLVGHPAPLLLLSALVSYFVYRGKGCWNLGAASRAWTATVRQTTSTTIGVSLMVMMALVITDSGMAATLARAAEAMGNQLYLLASPFIGLLGAFVTGSNTNSNVMFGPLQLFASQALALSTVLVAAAQTLGGSIGSGVAPDKALIGVSVVGGDVGEEEVMRYALLYGLLVVLVIGMEVLLLCTGN